MPVRILLRALSCCMSAYMPRLHAPNWRFLSVDLKRGTFCRLDLLTTSLQLH